LNAFLISRNTSRITKSKSLPLFSALPLLLVKLLRLGTSRRYDLGTPFATSLLRLQCRNLVALAVVIILTEAERAGK
jgi:hypothetical protein